MILFAGNPAFTAADPGYVLNPFLQADPLATFTIGDSVLSLADSGVYTLTTLAVSITDAVLHAATPRSATSLGRKGFMIFNNCPTAYLYVVMQGTNMAIVASWSNLRIPPMGVWVMDPPIYQGEVHGIWDTVTGGGKAMITEVT